MTGSSAPPPRVLQLDQISKRFGSVLANDGISLTLQQGEVLALLGENGAGKTTLMNILFGHYLPDQGHIEAFGQPLKLGSPYAAIQAGIGMVHQHFMLAENLSVLDNIILGTEPLWWIGQDRRSARRRLVDLVQRFGLEVDPATRVGDLAVGERQRVEILKALYRQARILILDEPTAVLTPQETDSLFTTLRKLIDQGLSVIFISHKLQEVMRISDRVMVLRTGRVVADLTTAATNPAELAELMVGQRIPQPVRQPLPPGDPVLELDGIAVANPKQRRLVIESVSLQVRQHQIVGIAGVSGNGQTALADLISGLVQPACGTFKLNGIDLNAVHAAVDPAQRVLQGVGRIPEDRHSRGVVGDMNLWENLILERHQDPRFSRWGWLKLRSIRNYAMAQIQAFDIRCASDQMPTRLLSGGNMQKLILVRALDQAPSLILAHQPTRGLDLGAVAYVHQQLLNARARGAGIVLISEDLDEILALSDQIYVIYQGQLSPPLDPKTLSIQAIGLLMTGHSLTEHLDAT